MMNIRSFGTALAVAALVVVPTTAVAGSQAHDTSPIWELPGVSTAVPGASASIVRRASGVTIRVRSSGFDAHHAVTLWAVSFDHPENCEHGSTLPDGRVALCGPGDDAAEDTGFSIQQVAGHVLGANGTANFAGMVVVANPLGAEFHVPLADHGTMDPAELPAQIMSPAPASQIAFFIP